MSYILDALRKADAQRERDPARGIHAQSTASVPLRPARSVAPWSWGAAAVGLVLAGAYAFWPERALQPAPALVPAVGLVQAAPVPSAVVTVATTVSPPAPPPLPAPVAPVAPGPQVKPVAAAPMKAALASAAAASAVPAPALATAKVAAPEADRILAFSELPADVQRQLPKLAISGGVHSANAAQRLLIVGGQLKTEGAELAPGLVLEQIRPRSAVLRFQGLRFSLGY